MTVNKAILLGRLGKNPEIRNTKGGDPVASFSLATDQSFKDRQGKRQDRTEWHQIVVWGKLADFADKYLSKGRLIYLEGRIQTREYTDKDDVKRYKTEIVATTIRFVGPAPEASKSGTKDEPPPAGATAPDDGEVSEDDIPF